MNIHTDVVLEIGQFYCFNRNKGGEWYTDHDGIAKQTDFPMELIEIGDDCKFKHPSGKISSCKATGTKSNIKIGRLVLVPENFPAINYCR